MTNLDRRSVLALGTAAATAPLALSSKASAQYGADEGTELMAGVRQVDISEKESLIPGYARVSMRDIVIEPGAEVEPFPMENDMVCHMLEGEPQQLSVRYQRPEPSSPDGIDAAAGFPSSRAPFVALPMERLDR